MKKILSIVLCTIISYFCIGQASKCTITSTYTKTNASCNGVADGRIEVTPTSGTGPFTYRIGTVGTFGPSNIFENLRPGKYTVSIRGTGGCAGITPQITIDPSSSLTAGITKTDPLCSGSANGTITLTPTGGTAPFTYKLGTAGTFGNNNTFTGLKAGKFLAYIKDVNNCVASAAITLVNPDPLAFTTTPSDALCYNSASGSVTITPTNGTPPYQYKLNPTGTYSNTNVLSGLKAGTYMVFVKDGSGCEASQSVTIAQPGKVSSCVQVEPVTCPGGMDGSVTINGLGGTAPYMYKLENKSGYSTSNSFTGLPTGNYRAFVKDNNGCETSTMTWVETPLPFNVTPTITNASCPGAADGSISITVTGGSQPYEYKINTSTSYSSSATFNNLTAKNYIVSVRDNNGCIYTLLLTVGQTSNICKGVLSEEKQPIKVTVETNKTLEVSVIPNPASDRFTVVTKSNTTLPIQIKVSDLNGKSLFITKGNADQQYKFGEELSPGMYLIEVRQGDMIKTVKAVKLK